MAQPIIQTINQNDTVIPFADTGFTSPDGMQFACWNTERDGSGQNYFEQQKIEVSQPLTLYAQYGHVITWNAQGGTTPEPYIRQQNQTIGTLPTSTKSDYTLSGWYTSASSGTKIDSSTVVAGSRTYYAQWTGQTYTLNDPKWLSFSDGQGESSEYTIFRKKPKGNYRLTFQKMQLMHHGDRTGHTIYLLVKARNSNDTSKYKYIDISENNTTGWQSARGIEFGNVQISHGNGSSYVTQVFDTMNGSGYGSNEGSGYFKPTFTINLPYAKTDITIRIWTPTDSCSGAALRFADGDNTAKITLTRI